MILYIGLFFHIVGIILISEGAVGSVFVENLFWKNAQSSSQKALMYAPLLKKLPAIIQVGSILMLLSGLLMLSAVSWTFVHQTWFIIKIFIYVALIANGVVIAKPTMIKIMTSLHQSNDNQITLLSLKKRMTMFNLVQFSLFVILIGLSVFRTYIR